VTAAVAEQLTIRVPLITPDGVARVLILGGGNYVGFEMPLEDLLEASSAADRLRAAHYALTHAE
jgi:hypothetical protein